MSAPRADTPVSLSTSGYEDGLGRRTLVFDRESGTTLERLILRPELSAFETALKARAARFSAFRDDRLARVKGVSRDMFGRLVVDAEFIEGDRLCDIIDAAALGREETAPDVDVALGFLLEVLPALNALHTSAGCAHGAVGPGRIVLTPTGSLVLLDTLFGQALERLQFSRARLWAEFGLAMPAAAGPSRFDYAADVAQAAMTALTLVIGRPLAAGDYPAGRPRLLSEVVEIAQIRGGNAFATGFHAFLQRALPLSDLRRPFIGAQEAYNELKEIVATEIGAGSCRTALATFVGEMSRMVLTPEMPARAPAAPAVASAAPPPPAPVVREEKAPLATLAVPDDLLVPQVVLALDEPPPPVTVRVPASEPAAPSAPVAPATAAASIPPPAIAAAPATEAAVAAPVAPPPAPAGAVPAPEALPAAAATGTETPRKPEKASPRRKRERTARTRRDKLRSNHVPEVPPEPLVKPASAPEVIPFTPPAPAGPAVVPRMPVFTPKARAVKMWPNSWASTHRNTSRMKARAGNLSRASA